MFIEDLEKINIKNKSQWSCTMFLARYVSLDIYDEYMEKILVLVYNTSLIPHLNPNIKSSTIETLVYLAEMIQEWLDISWGCTNTCGCRKFFKPLHHLLNSWVFLLIINSPNQLGTLMTISHGKGAIYFSILFLLVLEFFAWQIVILQKWTKVITIREWPIIELR